jgi:macrolide transport system ATP-binding/permease protein
MLLFSVQDLVQCFDGQDIFRGVSFGVQTGEKVALVGANGIGKTSLLKIIAGIDRPASGRFDYYTSTSCALLTQCLDFSECITVRATLEQALPANSSNHKVGEALKKFDFYGREEQVVNNLSGGEKTRLQLACIWLSGAEFLLLDEPTNHLDVENLEWLERFIREYPGTLIIVSHDRYFLDQTVSRVLELRKDGIISHVGNYSAYRQAKLEQFGRDEKTYFDQEKQARKLDSVIQEKKVWATRAHNRAGRKAIVEGCKKGGKPYYRAKAKKIDRQVQNTIKRLERFKEERIVRPKNLPTIDLSFTAGQRASNGILLADKIAKAFGNRQLLVNSNFALKYGEKVGLLGANGSGKTTLLRMIAGLESLDAGILWRSPSLRIGYLEQEMQLLGQERAVLEEVSLVCPDQGRVRNILADLLLSGEAVFKPCKVLSMGERVRVAITKLLLSSYDLLLLDEPTNYLDLDSREQLEEALACFGGSLLIVSHDRYFLERIAETIWVIENGKIRVYPGRYVDYVANRCSHIAEELSVQSYRLELELKKARLIGELSLAKNDCTRNESEYLRLEQEFLETVRQLKCT